MSGQLSLGAVLVAVLLWCAPAEAAPGRAAAPQRVSFKSEDGLRVTADLYMADPRKDSPFIVLFHQAGWSRGEYLMIAPILNKLGFNCLAVDQRSGRAVNGVDNLTAREAKLRGKRTTFLYALPDMRAALRYARAKWAKGKLIAWGSSYSAALVLVMAGRHPKLLDGALAFSPGEYFRRFGKPGNWVHAAAAKIHKPVFMTSTRDEWPGLEKMFGSIPSRTKAMFRPETNGQHGSRALWAVLTGDSRRDYWYAVSAFLGHFSRRPVRRTRPGKKHPAPRRTP